MDNVYPVFRRPDESARRRFRSSRYDSGRCHQAAFTSRLRHAAAFCSWPGQDHPAPASHQLRRQPLPAQRLEGGRAQAGRTAGVEPYAGEALPVQGSAAGQVYRRQQASQGACQPVGSERLRSGLPARQPHPHPRGLEGEIHLLLGHDLPQLARRPLRALPLLGRQRLGLGLRLARQRLPRLQPCCDLRVSIS